jgi:hypothetical protein
MTNSNFSSTAFLLGDDPSDPSKGPRVIGRGEDDLLDPRAETRLAAHVVAENAYDFGGCDVKVFLSEDDEDRGGVVLRFSARAQNGGWIPHAENTTHGCEVHLAGDGERSALLSALHVALTELLERNKLVTGTGLNDGTRVGSFPVG